MAWASSLHDSWLPRGAYWEKNRQRSRYHFWPISDILLHVVLPYSFFVEVIIETLWSSMAVISTSPLDGKWQDPRRAWKPRNVAMTTFGNHSVLQLELKAFSARRKLERERERAAQEQLTNQTYRRSTPPPCLSLRGTLQSVLTEHWTAIKHFNATWSELLLH